jgi:electron transfer flavoprotein alpha subunit
MSTAPEVWVWSEQRRGKLMDVSLELLGKGRELAEKLGADLAAVMLGDGVEGLAGELLHYGANKVYLLEHPALRLYEGNLYAKILADIAKSHEPKILLVGATTLGRELSAAVAARLGTGLIAHCIDLHIDKESRLVQVVPGQTENTLVEYSCLRSPQMATVRPGVFPRPERNQVVTGQIVKLVFKTESQDAKARTVELFEEEPSKMQLEGAGVVVAGGWGLYSVGGFEAIKELAEILGAVIGGTRPAADKGWVSQESMIGQSGKTVSPKLFISIGASGAMHFTTGFLRSKVILAIDQNPKAPIFEVADIGIIGDLRTILPLLSEELKKVNKRGSN